MASTIELTAAQQNLWRVIRRGRARWRLRLALRGVAFVVGGAVVPLRMSAWGMEQFRFAPTAVVWLRVAWFVAVIASIGWFIVRPLLRQVDDERVALYLEEHEPSLETAVLSAVDHARTEKPIEVPSPGLRTE